MTRSRYRLQEKSVAPAAPPAGGGAADPAVQGQADAVETVEQHEWAGDLYEEGDESDPATAYARFLGGAGEESWLDRADDGTLTAWVRDADGSVYRYSDVDAWAVDVDEASMNRSDGPAASDEPLGDDGDDPADDATDDAETLGEDEADPFAEDGDDFEDEAPETAALDDETDAEVPAEDDPDKQLPEDEDDPQAPPFKRKRR